MCRPKPFLCAAFLVLTSCLTSTGSFAGEQVAFFSGKEGLDFDASPAFCLASPATVELWVKPTWVRSPGYDPCVLASIGERGVDFAIHISADKQSIGLYAGDRFLSAPFDFTGDVMHHLVIVSYGPGLSEVQVDGETVGLLDIGFFPSVNLGLHVGSLDGDQAPFIGAIARIRLWNAPAGAEDEPDPESLAAQSRFTDDGMEITTYPPPEDDR